MGIKAIKSAKDLVKEPIKESVEERIAKLCEKRSVVSDKMDELKVTKEAYNEAIKKLLGGFKKETYGNYSVSYTETKSNSIDTAFLKSKYPKTAKACTKESVGSRLTISLNKGAKKG